MMYEFRKGLIAAVIPFSLLAGACAAPQPGETGPVPEGETAEGPRIASEGVYTVAQAERGSTAFETSCSTCHNVEEFTGTTFQGTWGARTMADIHQFISEMMPMDAPGSLTTQQYTDIVAFIIRANGFPAGSTELPTSTEALRQIRFQPAR